MRVTKHDLSTDDLFAAISRCQRTQKPTSITVPADQQPTVENILRDGGLTFSITAAVYTINYTAPPVATEPADILKDHLGEISIDDIFTEAMESANEDIAEELEGELLQPDPFDEQTVPIKEMLKHFDCSHSYIYSLIREFKVPRVKVRTISYDTLGRRKGARTYGYKVGDVREAWNQKLKQRFKRYGGLI